MGSVIHSHVVHSEEPFASAAERREPIRVLVIEPHPLMRAGIRAVLDTMNGVQLVGQGTNSADALRLAQETQPDVVLLDIDAPDDSGLAATKTLTASERRPRVIALTILSEHETIVQALRAGASGLLSKDAAEDDLAAALRSAASGEIYLRPGALSELAASVRRHVPTPEERTARAKYEALSDRERAVLGYVASGLTGPEIGELLLITAKTVDTYRHRIRAKIGLLHRADYIRFALLIGLLKKE